MPTPSIQLSNEDNLRLNVLMAQKPKVIRINESNMTLYALTARGEVSIKLHPQVKDDTYLRWVRELLSMKVTGSPSGYPVFIKRWTRMGHTQNTLEHMLLLGEPEAIVAAAYSEKLSHEIAGRIWWANPNTEIARQLLSHQVVVEGELGKELSSFLMEFLPYEESQLNMVRTVHLCLQGDLLSRKQRADLWKKAKRKNSYYVGFIHAPSIDTPEKKTQTRHHAALADTLQPLIDQGNAYAAMLLNLQSAQGQEWLSTFKYALTKPVDQDVVISLFIAVNTYFKPPHSEFRGVREINTALQRAKDYCQCVGDVPTEVQTVLVLLNETEKTLFEASLVLSQLGEETLNPIFSGNESLGSFMRKRLLPVSNPTLERIKVLMS